METFFGVLVPITLFLGLFTTLVFLRKYENDERMAMIEKGLEPVNKKKTDRFGTLRFALLSIGIGIGIVLSIIIVQLIPKEPHQVTKTTSPEKLKVILNNLPVKTTSDSSSKTLVITNDSVRESEEAIVEKKIDEELENTPTVTEEYTEYSRDSGLVGAIYSGMILIFGGLGLLMAYRIRSKQKKLEE
ncbi:MAG TPA: hypothetical protein PLT47_08630 [Bacteroidales bacterium]|nr:hypothetical protein [Bacteroidales bacterium]HQI70801.1 hypothetical protein [Bacteroidales bacterium]